MYSPLSVSREWEVVMNECGVEDYDGSVLESSWVWTDTAKLTNMIIARFGDR